MIIIFTQEGKHTYKTQINTMADHWNACDLPFGAARLCQDLATLVNNRQGSDIQFKVGGHTSILQENGETIYNESETVTLYAHSLILRCRSRYFASMLDEDKHWKESSSGVIYKPNISPSTFQDVLHYIYTGNVRAESSQSIMDLISAAEEMELEELSTKCQVELIKRVESDYSNEIHEDSKRFESEISTRPQALIDIAIRTHVISAMNLAYSHFLSHLSQKLQEIILRDIPAIVKSPDTCITFINSICFNALYKIIESDNLAMTERNIWDFALNCGCHQINVSKMDVEAYFSNLEDEESNEESPSGTVISSTQLSQLKIKLAPLLPAIRFSLLDTDDYYEISDMLNYFLPLDRYSDLNQFFTKPDITKLLDIPRDETPELGISSKIIAKHLVWGWLKDRVFESGCINGCLSVNRLKFGLLFRASEHDYLAKAFHQHCDDKGPTLVLVRSTDGHLFGGVNFNDWKSDNGWLVSTSNFLFTLDGNDQIWKIIVSYNTYNSSISGPSFSLGWGRFEISDSANTNFSVGEKDFLVSEYEVFAISSC